MGELALKKEGRMVTLDAKKTINLSTETQSQRELDIQSGRTEPRCANDCGTSLREYRGNRKYCDECLPIVDKRRRKKRREAQEKASAERTEAGWQEYRERNPAVYALIKQDALKNITGRFSVRGAFYDMRKIGFRIRNSYSPYCARDLLRDHPELKSIITVVKK